MPLHTAASCVVVTAQVSMCFTCTGLLVTIACASWTQPVQLKAPPKHRNSRAPASSSVNAQNTNAWGEPVGNVKDTRPQQMKTKGVTQWGHTVDPMWPSPFLNYTFSTENCIRISEPTNRPLIA